MSDVQRKAKALESVALSLYNENGDSLTADMVRQKAAVPADEHFIVTISVKNGSVSKISYFTKDYSVSYANGVIPHLRISPMKILKIWYCSYNSRGKER